MVRSTPRCRPAARSTSANPHSTTIPVTTPSDASRVRRTTPPRRARAAAQPHVASHRTAAAMNTHSTGIGSTNPLAVHGSECTSSTRSRTSGASGSRRSARCHAATLRAVSATAHAAVPRFAHASGARGIRLHRLEERLARGDELVASVCLDARVERASRIAALGERVSRGGSQRGDDHDAHHARENLRARAAPRRRRRDTIAPRARPRRRAARRRRRTRPRRALAEIARRRVAMRWTRRGAEARAPVLRLA